MLVCILCHGFGNEELSTSLYRRDYSSTGKPRGRQPKVPKHNVDSGGVINISDDSSSDSDGMETDSNSSPDSLLDNDDVIFVNHTNGQTGSPLVYI